jgi:hypothetical protein
MPDRISFTRPAVERIANAVRAVENARPGGEALGFSSQVSLGKTKVVKLASFSGPWAKGSEKAITFKGTEQTASASNLFYPVPGTQTRECAVAKIGTAWHLISVPFSERTAVFAGETATETVLGTASARTITYVPSASTKTITYIPPGSTETLNYISSVTPEVSTISFLTGVTASLDTSNCTITVTPSIDSRSVVTGIKQQMASATVVTDAEETATVAILANTQTATVVSLDGTMTITLLTSTYTSHYLTLEPQ